MKRFEFSMMSLFSNPTSVRSTSRGFRSMNRSLIAIAGLAVLGFSCKDSNNDANVMGDWRAESPFEGVARSQAASFVVGTKAYVATGWDSNNNRLADMWEYDSDRNTWTQKANFPGVARTGAAAFAIGSKGYLGLGQPLGGQYLKDFYSYDPTTNKWTKIEDYAGTGRVGTVSFVINNKGYVGTGFDGNNLNDIYSYSPATATWTKETSFAGGKRQGAVAMVINNIAYVGTGTANNLSPRDWWAFDPSTQVWTQKKDFTNDQATIARSYASSFVINNTGYLLMGSGGDNKVWAYDAATDLWSDVQNFGENASNFKVTPSSRQQAVSFSIGNRGFITTGVGGSTRYDDIYSFDPAKARVLAE